jgi:hypothetical protein
VAPKRHLEKDSYWQLQLLGFPINLIEPVSRINCYVQQKLIHHRIPRIYCLNIALQDLYSSAGNVAGVDKFLFYGPTKCLKSDFEMISEIEIIVYSTIGTVLFFDFGFHDSEVMRCLKTMVAQLALDVSV